MLEAIISFFPSEGAGAIGSLEWSKEERQRCARESVGFRCPACGLASELLKDPSAESAAAETAMAQEVADQIAQLRLSHVRSQSMSSEASDGGRKEDASPRHEGDLSPVFPSLASPYLSAVQQTPPRAASSASPLSAAATPASAASTASLASPEIPETPPSVRVARRIVLAERAQALAGSAGGSADASDDIGGRQLSGNATSASATATDAPAAAVAAEAGDAAPVTAAAGGGNRGRERQAGGRTSEAEQRRQADLDLADGVDRLLQGAMFLVAGLLVLLLSKKCYRMAFDSSNVNFHSEM